MVFISQTVNTEIAILNHLFESGVFWVRPLQIAIMKASQKTYSAYLEQLYNRPDCVDRSQRNVCYVDTSEVTKSETCSVKLTDLELCLMVRNLHAFSLIARMNIRYKGLYNVLAASKAGGNLVQCKNILSV